MSEGTAKPSKTGKALLIILTSLALFIIVAALLYAGAFGPMEKTADTEQFLVTPNETSGEIGDALTKAGFVRSPWVFQLAYLRESEGHAIRPGGYEISKSMDAWTIASQLEELPYVAWVTVPVGLRKEQVGDLLAEELNWTPQQLVEWNTVDTDPSPNYSEGVYFPDTYLIPTDEAPALIAERMRNHFKEEFAPYADEALKKGVPWPRVLIIASLIEREAGSGADMPIISGIIKNRLKIGMPLAVDATLQYMTGTEGNWWPVPKSASTYADGPFNTYKRTGLPPHPIASPGIAAIEAALNPASTDCLFYIHDYDGKMHCSKTYSGQLANVNKYLK